MASAAILELISTIEATGGLVRHADGLTPKADNDWYDLAIAYLCACEETGHEPMIAPCAEHPECAELEDNAKPTLDPHGLLDREKEDV